MRRRRAAAKDVSPTSSHSPFILSVERFFHRVANDRPYEPLGMPKGEESTEARVKRV
jgi:hypothetical protein